MPAKKGKRDNTKSEAAVPENTEEPVVKKGRAVKESKEAKEAVIEKPKKMPAAKGKAKKPAEDDEVADVPDEVVEEETASDSKNGSQEEKAKRGGRGKKEAPKKTDEDPIEKRELRGRKAKQPVDTKEEPAAKVPKPKAGPKGKAAKETKATKAAAPAAKEKDDSDDVKEAPKPKGKGKGRGKQASPTTTTEENVVDEKGDAKQGTQAESSETASATVDVEACKS